CSMNRREVVLATLARVFACGLRADDFDVWLVDNASTDGTVDAVIRQFPAVNLIVPGRNLGGVARNRAMERARGEYIVMLDDDSYPMPGSVARMVQHFERDPDLGAAVFTVMLPDGREESSAYPNVFIGCGTGFRRSALENSGLLPTDFFMQAEEYDLSLRLLDAGWKIERFDDLLVHHLKTSTARRPARTTRLDVRNNLLLIGRRFPRGQRARFALDWTRRYWWIANQNGHRQAFVRGVVEGVVGGWTNRRRPVSRATFDRFARLSSINDCMRKLRASGAKRVLLLDAGKAVASYVRAALDAGLEVCAIADDRLAAKGRNVCGVPIVTDQTARTLAFDGVVVSNLSPAHAKTRRESWRLATGVCAWNVLESEPMIPTLHIPFNPMSGPISGADRAEAPLRQTAARSVSQAA
ncbi:MAG TPA: glycosyltransferase, partial [Tepidisphaeraceae bacterium]|nr:glycosyltransferase [Tepidisphaeraceae bacterium]